jgi:hypothetical protein
MFYVSDDEITLPNRPDEPDFCVSTTTTTSRFATDDSNGSLNSRFDRELEFGGGRKSGKVQVSILPTFYKQIFSCTEVKRAAFSVFAVSKLAQKLLVNCW